MVTILSPVISHALLPMTSKDDKRSLETEPSWTLKVSTYERTSPCVYSLQLVPWKVFMKGLQVVAGTCPTNSSHEAFWGTSRKDLSQKFKLLWIRGTSHRDQSWSLRLDFEAKMASSHDGTYPRDLLQGLVSLCVRAFTYMLQGLVPLCVRTFTSVAVAIVKRLSVCIDCLLRQKILAVAGRWLSGGLPVFRIPYPWNSLL